MLALVIALAVACGGDTARPATTPHPTTPSTAPLSGTITVFAASSLTEAFKGIATAFQQANPGVTVRFNFAASSALATQIEQAAPVDVFASADTANMDKVAGKSLVEGAPVTLARNRPVIVVPADNRAGITGAKDLAKPGIKLVFAGPDVPIGNYTRQILDRLAAHPAYGAAYRDATMRNLVSNEANVRAVLAKIELGEADAGVVYRTDALVSGAKVRVIAIPDSANVIAVYPIAVVRASKNREAATAFVRYVTGPEAQTMLQATGFDTAR